MIILIIYIIVIIILALIKKINIFEAFSKGIKNSFKTVLNLFPSVLFFVIGINIFINSGIIELIETFCERLKIIPEIIIQFILRPVSNSSSLLMMINIFNKYGANSFLGKLSTLIQVASDTTVYIVIIYFSSIGIKKIEKLLFLGLLINILSFVMAFIFCYIFYKIF